MIFSALENDTKIFLALLNIRSLVNNLDNFLTDVNIQRARVIWLTETHLRNLFNKSQLIIQNKMPDSYIIFSNSNDNYKSLVSVFKKDMFTYQDKYWFLIFVQLLSFCQFLSFKLWILHRNQISFLDILIKIVS